MNLNEGVFEIASMNAPAGFTGAIRMDLAELAHNHVSFLRRLHGLGVTLTAPSEESIRRYVDLWLPLVSKVASTGLAIIPPADIAWIWHCHRLSTKLYADYTVDQFGANATVTTQLNGGASAFQFLTKDSPRNLKQYSVDYWELYYRGEPFFVDLPSASAIGVTAVTASLKSKLFALARLAKGWSTTGVSTKRYDANHDLFGFDVLECSKNQASFLWNISGPDFHFASTMVLDEAFLVQCAQNYELFLQLQHHADHLLVPTYAIDL